MVIMILWFLNLRHSLWCVFPHLSSTDIPFSSCRLKAKYVELLGKGKGYNSSYVYCQVKGWFKKSCEIFSNDFGKSFWNGMMEGKKMGIKGFWSCNVFLLSKYWLSLFICRDSWSFTFPSSLFQYFFSLSLSFNAPSLWVLGDFDDKRGENTLQKFLFRGNRMEWLSHDYENGGVVDILAMNAYSKMELCTPILLGEASKKNWMVNHFQKNSKPTMNTSLNKAQHKQVLLCE
jgi:hypothetical protein